VQELAKKKGKVYFENQKIKHTHLTNNYNNIIIFKIKK